MSKKPTNSDKFTFTDTFVVEMARTDAVDVKLPNQLKIEIGATSSGFVNGNNMWYTDDLLKNSAHSFIEPYPKPIMSNHSKDQNDTVGRIQGVEFVPVERKTPNGRTGFLRLIGTVSGKENVEKVKDKRFYTVSMKAVPTENTIITCSICNKQLTKEELNPYSDAEHEHDPGQEYDGKKCYYIIDGEWEYRHVAYVPEPADKETYTREYHDEIHYAKSEVSMTDSIKTEDQINDTEQKEAGTVDEQNQEGKNADTNEETPDVQTTDSDNPPAENSEPETQDDNSDWADITSEDSEEIVKLDASIEELVEEDAKLSTKKREELPSSSFCGPNRSFPANDCAHVRAGFRLLNRAKVSESTKNKIQTCLNKKNESLNCGVGKQDEDTNAEINYLDLPEVKKHITDNYYPKSEIDEVIAKTITAIKASVVDEQSQLTAKKYEDLKKSFNDLEDRHSALASKMSDVKFAAIKAIKLLSTPGVTDAEITVTAQDIENFDVFIKGILEDNATDSSVETQETVDETSKPADIQDEIKERATEYIDITSMSTEDKINLINDMCNKQ